MHAQCERSNDALCTHGGCLLASQCTGRGMHHHHAPACYLPHKYSEHWGQVCPAGRYPPALQLARSPRCLPGPRRGEGVHGGGGQMCLLYVWCGWRCVAAAKDNAHQLTASLWARRPPLSWMPSQCTAWCARSQARRHSRHSCPRSCAAAATLRLPARLMGPSSLAPARHSAYRPGGASTTPCYHTPQAASLSKS